MLAASTPIAFIASAAPERAKAFYRDVLNLSLVADDQFAIIFDAAGTMLRIQKVDTLSPQPFTVLGWGVGDIAATALALAAAGVALERYPWLPGGQDDLGIWRPSGEHGDQIAWFKDPDGNLLSVTQFGDLMESQDAPPIAIQTRTSRRVAVRLVRSTAGRLYPGVPYAYASIVSPGTAADLVFTAGACPLDQEGRTVGAGDVRRQARQAVANLAEALAGAGAALTDVLKTTVYVASAERADLVAAWDEIKAAFGDHEPPSTLLGVAALGYPDQLVEIEAVALHAP